MPDYAEEKDGNTKGFYTTFDIIFFFQFVNQNRFPVFFLILFNYIWNQQNNNCNEFINIENIIHLFNNIKFDILFKMIDLK